MSSLPRFARRRKLLITKDGKKKENMAEIIYFGTNGKSGHYPIGIDKTLTNEEYEKWSECDKDVLGLSLV